MKKDVMLINSLENEVVVPDIIVNRITDTLACLPDTETTGRVKRQKRTYRNSIWLKSLSSVAAVFILLVIVCISNPAFAAKLPFIGRIFSQVQDDTTFKGDFSNRAQPLENDERAGAEVPSGETVQGIFVAEDKGIRLTASEVYCDGVSVFLTAQLEYLNGDARLTTVPSVYTSRYSGIHEESEEMPETTAQMLFPMGEWSLEGKTERAGMDDTVFEGKAVDDNTFIGMLVVPLDMYRAEDGVLNLYFKMIRYDSTEDDLFSEEMYNSEHRSDGEWNLVIPYTVDREDTRIITVDEYMEEGSGLEKVLISPYQVIVYTKVPVSHREDNEETRALYDKWFSGVKEEEFSYEAFLAEDLYEEEQLYDVIVYTKDGIPLDPQGSFDNNAYFSSQGLDVSDLYVFAKRGEWLSMIKSESIEDARNKCDIEVHLTDD